MYLKSLKGKMTLVEPSEEDRKQLKEVMGQTVIPSWAKRCSADCVESFNQYIGPIVDITANK